VLLDGDRIVRAALDRRVVSDDHALEPVHAADAGDDAAGRDPVVVEFMARKLADLEERRTRVDQPVDAVAHQHLAATLMLRAGRG